jgi:hypothetical protein
MKVGPGWIPDFVQVAVDPSASICRLTLIELEATETAARASCRKYLPESSAGVLQSFFDYLDSVISACHATADPRLEGLEELKNILRASPLTSVHTAGALRTSVDLIEDLPLIDQPGRSIPALVEPPKPLSSFSFNGERRLTRADSDGVRRTIRILSAVVVGRDHSGGTMHSWQNIRQKPLDRSVAKEHNRYPHLRKFLTSKTEHGLNVNCDKLAGELALLWSAESNQTMNPQDIATVIGKFIPVAVTFKAHEPMEKVFDKAREMLRASDLRGLPVLRSASLL